MGGSRRQEQEQRAAAPREQQAASPAALSGAHVDHVAARVVKVGDVDRAAVDHDVLRRGDGAGDRALRRLALPQRRGAVLPTRAAAAAHANRLAGCVDFARVLTPVAANWKGASARWG